MNASELQEGLRQVGLLDSDIERLSLDMAKKVFITRVNEMVPPGAEDEPNIPPFLVDIYNRLDEELVQDWPEPITGRRKSAPKPKGPKEPQKRGPKTKDKSHIPPTTETPNAFRGRAVKNSRGVCVVEALRIGGTRDEVIIMADKMFMRNGGGSNYKQTEWIYMNTTKILKTLGLLEVQGKTLKLKHFEVK